MNIFSSKETITLDYIPSQKIAELNKRLKAGGIKVKITYLKNGVYATFSDYKDLPMLIKAQKQTIDIARALRKELDEEYLRD